MVCALLFQSVLMTIVCVSEFEENVTRDDDSFNELYYCNYDTFPRHALKSILFYRRELLLNHFYDYLQQKQSKLDENVCISASFEDITSDEM